MKIWAPGSKVKNVKIMRRGLNKAQGPVPLDRSCMHEARPGCKILKEYCIDVSYHK